MRFDELVEHHREGALELMRPCRNLDLAYDLQSAYDGIRAAGMTVAEVRAMPNPGSSLSLRDTAAHVRELLSRWPQTLTPARRTQRSQLLEWAQKLDEATDIAPMN